MKEPLCFLQSGFFFLRTAEGQGILANFAMAVLHGTEISHMAIIDKDIEKAAALLLQNQVVAIPTETVYGLAGNALNEEAVSRIYQVKNRPATNPLIMHIKGKEEIDTYAHDVPQVIYDLADRFWPGPLTVLLPKRSVVPDTTTSGSDKVALRMPGHPLTLELLKSLPFPLAAPSANPFGYISPTRPEHVQQQIGERIEMILDGGACESGVESTIVGVEGDTVLIYRLGYITADDIKRVLPEGYQVALNTDSKPVAPGMLPYHYSPNTPLFLFDDIAEVRNKLTNDRTGLIRFSHATAGHQPQVVLSQKGDLKEAARKLYASLIDLDDRKLAAIYCERFPETGLGHTLNERLQKASSKKPDS
ncbi:L-threonylcarbamoyladenylate synthase [Robertkochia aurantiaca]|uniref:L-threonylcarbamoyladenylate synthase n=1 Tax=Robertkochia aurantiaca TaxID=2873700 RepID=UPI001CCDB598|nr:L-threonylcarbamoyladenylate synthase [Robertkochia sp. 3YJGBD-33]